MKASEAYLYGTDALVASETDDGFDALFEEVASAVAAHNAPEPQQMRSTPNKEGGRTVDGGGPPLGALVPFVAPVKPETSETPKTLKSEIESVSDEDWTKFVMAMKTAAYGDVSASNAFGAWEMRPRRLADLGLMENLKRIEGPSKRTAWVGTWVEPLTAKKFLESPAVQYRTFSTSMRRYVEGLVAGTIDKGDDAEMTTSGMLAVLHRCGPSGLKNWSRRSERFTDTIDLFHKVNGVF